MKHVSFKQQTTNGAELYIVIKTNIKIEISFELVPPYFVRRILIFLDLRKFLIKKENCFSFKLHTDGDASYTQSQSAKMHQR